MNRSITLLLGSMVGLFLLPVAEVPASAACGDIYPAMSLGPFSADATPPVFYGADAQSSGSFKVRFTGLACGQAVAVSAEYSDSAGSAVEGVDYSMPSGRTPNVCETGCPKEQTVPFTILGDGVEPVAESFTITLGNPLGGSLDPPSNAPFVLVDGDGPNRVGFDDLPYFQSESYDTLVVPVWLAGPATGATVSYTVGAGPGAGATPNDDFAVVSPNPLVFAGGDRVELITLSVVNDQLSEGEETVQIDLQGAASPSSKVVTIQDNEENVPPTSRIHHPRHKWRYRKGDYRIREVHVFSHDNPQGSGVTGTQFALRRNLENGDCVWLTKGGWQKKDCQNREWLDAAYDETGQLWRVRLKQLKSSVGTRIRNYTAYSRAIDGAGNVERTFKEKRNANTFEVKRSRRRR
jgi:Calx-beta domain-containing protein